MTDASPSQTPPQPRSALPLQSDFSSENMLLALQHAGMARLANALGADPQLLQEVHEALPILAGPFARLVNRTPSAIFELSPEGIVLFANKGLSRMCGYEADDLVGRNWFDRLFLFAPGQKARADIFLRQCQTRDVLDFELSLTASQGNEVVLALYTANDYAVDGRLERIVGCGINLTVRKQVERRLRTSQRALAEGQRMAHIGSWSGEISSDTIELSDEGFRLLGYEPGEVRADCALLLNAVHPEDREAVAQARRNARESGTPAMVEYRIIRTDGRVRHMQGRFEVERDHQGRPVREWGTTQDVTEQKRAELALRRSQRLLAEAQRIAHLGNWVWDVETGNIDVSDEGYHIFGYAPGSVTPTQALFLAALHPEDRPRVEATIDTLLHGDRTTESLSYRIIRPDGAVRWIRARGKVEFGADGTPRRVVGTVEDATEQETADRALRESEERLRLIAEAVEDAFWVGAPDNSAVYYVSPGYGRIWGLDPQSLLRDPASYLASIHPQDRPRAQALFAAHAECRPEATGRWDQEYRVVRPDGTVRWVRDRGYPVFDAEGNARLIAGIVTDITERKEAEEATKASEERYRLLVEQAGDGIVVCDFDCRCSIANRAFCQILGCDPQALKHIDLRDMVAPQDVAHLEEVGARLRSDPTYLHRGEWALRRPDGRFVPVDISARLLPGDRIQAIVRDISARKQTEQKLRQAATVFENTAEGIVIADGEQHIISINRAYTEITGYSEQDVLGENLLLLQSGVHDTDFYRELNTALQHDGRWQGEVWNRRKDGTLFPAWQSIGTICEDGAIASYISVFSDISATRQAEERIQRLAHYDPLTNIPNRLLFAARLDSALERAKRHKRQFALLFLDLDRFKIINDTLGHAYGDRLLQVVAGRLNDSVRAGDTVARFGGDEFSIILDEVSHPEDAAILADKIISAVSHPVQVDGQELRTSSSIGISVFPNDGADGETLTKAADAALYQAKERGRNTYWFYTTELTRRAAEFLSLDHSLRQALARSEFALYYQPQFDLQTRRISGIEALLRWRHPEKGLLLPETFLALAEETRLIEKIGEWVLHEACNQGRRWIASGYGPLRVAVNLSGSEVLYGHITERVQDVLRRLRLSAGELQLELEVTENILQSAEGTVETLRDLKSLGLTLSIDDFGTGYSALSSLKQLPIDRLKIDRSFLVDVATSTADRTIAGAIVEIGHSLGLTVVAEGVESEQQLDFLRMSGCDEAQGNYFSVPLSAADMGRLLHTQREASR